MSARRLAVALVAASSMAALGAFAAGATIESDTLASGSEPVTGCDSTPDWSYAYVKNETSGQVEAVTVTQIDDECEGGDLTVNIAASSGSAELDSCDTTCTETVAIEPDLDPGDVDDVDAIVLGP